MFVVKDKLDLKYFHRAATTVKFYWLEEVWVTGYLAEYLNIPHIDMTKYYIFHKGELMLDKSMQNLDIYNEDFVSGPMERDLGLSLSMALHIRARWCYNNVYQEHRFSEMVKFSMIKTHVSVTKKINVRDIRTD